MPKIDIELIGFGLGGRVKPITDVLKELFENEPFSKSIRIIYHPNLVRDIQGSKTHAFIRVYDADTMRGKEVANKINDRSGIQVQFIPVSASFYRLSN